MIIDQHAHIKWNSQEHTYDIEDCIQDMDENGIMLRVISAMQGDGIREQNQAVENFVHLYPNRLLGCAVINPKDPDYYNELERISKMACFVAIELDGNEHCYFPEHCEHMNEIMDFASMYHLLVHVFTGWGYRSMPAQWAIYAKRDPSLIMVLLHMGSSDFGYGCIELVPNYDNLYVETSCMYEFPILRKAFRNIDPHRFLFGSHYPHKFTCCSIHTFDLLELPKKTRKLLFYENAYRLLQEHMVESI